MFEYAAYCYRGINRFQNEDRVFLDNRLLSSGTLRGESDNSLLALVCDGVGGEKGGAVAAELVARSFMGYDVGGSSPASVSRHLRAVNRAVLQEQASDSSFDHMASTVSGIMLYNNKFLHFNIGDSRVYVFSDGKLIQLSTDHTIRLNDEGSEVLSHYIGGDGSFCLPSIKCGRIEHDTAWFFICSDGVYKKTPTDNLQSIFDEDTTAEEKQRAILKSALQNGSADDISIVVIRYAA